MVTNFGKLMQIKWGLGFYNSEAFVFTKNKILRQLCHWYLRLRGFKEKKEVTCQ